MGNEADRDSLVILVFFSQFVGEKHGQSFEASFSLIRHCLTFEPNLGSYQPVGRWWGGPRRRAGLSEWRRGHHAHTYQSLGSGSTKYYPLHLGLNC